MREELQILCQVTLCHLAEKGLEKVQAQ
jgi:hypothetical protein